MRIGTIYSRLMVAHWPIYNLYCIIYLVIDSYKDNNIFTMQTKAMSKSDGKDKALRQSGTFNPHALAVKDLLFLEVAFFDAADLVQVKYEMLRRVKHDAWSISRAADCFGFSRPTYYAARRALDAGGLWGLVPERRGPRGAFKLTADLVEFLEGRLAEDPHLTWVDLVGELDKHVGLRVHPRTIKRRLEARQKKR